MLAGVIPAWESVLQAEILSHVSLVDLLLCSVIRFSFFFLCETINLEASPSEAHQAWRRAALFSKYHPDDP